MKSFSVLLLFGCLFATSSVAAPPPVRPSEATPRTERHYLSGHGPDDAVPWDFQVTGGRRAGEKATIPVPSHWEQHGFGTYNYGQDDNRASEHGLYRTRFHIPSEWKGRRINLVFDGSMTDTDVTLNGRKAGPVHQGGFTRFRYDVTSLVKLGSGESNENVLEIDVAKASADLLTDRAERGGDYWVFGGIYRPVFLEALPPKAIDQLAVDARADGSLLVDMTLGFPPGGRTDGPAAPALHVQAQVIDAGGESVGAPFTQSIPRGGSGRIRIEGKVPGVRTWTAETPNLYTLRVTLFENDKGLHQTETRIGFRTFEVRDGIGLFLNGRRILLKGVNRHSFRPETGRALTRKNCYEDVRLIRRMNMNAVRMSHYPPDEAFLEACDELGLYVLDELSGWQHAHGTPIGRLLVREVVERDVNHPSILFWDNGNEGGWNPALDGDFSLYDPQRRRVLHPWNLFSGIDTRHYANFPHLMHLLGGPNLVMPTEILHALYDGGAGAGLEDYWNAISTSKVGAGLFIWDYADEAIQRTDLGNKLDTHSTYGADGIVGPHFEKEGSYYAVRDIWSPVQFVPPSLNAAFDGRITVHNRYDFASLSRCRFTWNLLGFKGGNLEALSHGNAVPPDVAPHAAGILELALPSNWMEAVALAVTATGPDGVELWTAVWPTPKATDSDSRVLHPADKAPLASGKPEIFQQDSRIVLVAGNTKGTFDSASGKLLKYEKAGDLAPIGNGPSLVFARPAAEGPGTWQEWKKNSDNEPTIVLSKPSLANIIEIEWQDLKGSGAYAGFTLEVTPDLEHWHTLFDSSRRPNDGKAYAFPPQIVAATRVRKLWRYDGAPPVLKTFRIGYEASRFPDPVSAPAIVTHGLGRDTDTGQAFAWVEAKGGSSGLLSTRWTLHADGSLRLDYAYELDGSFLYHGVTFDSPEEGMRTLRWWGQGPTRVWQNRLRGTWLGLHETVRSEQRPGETWNYPEFRGCFAGIREAELTTTAGVLLIIPSDSDNYLRVGTPRIDHPNTTVEFPPGDLSLLRAIPAIGSKMHPPIRSGPQSQPAKAKGRYEGSIEFGFRPAGANRP
ncbi:MAG: hypothetical protein KBA71_01115 [Opitutaceae bacterium]|nr:hypothetical protein [Opitutaceae bacterium]